jgi:hypothetical protein
MQGFSMKIPSSCESTSPQRSWGVEHQRIDGAGRVLALRWRSGRPVLLMNGASMRRVLAPKRR